MRILASLFSIELCACMVMSNHSHLIVRLISDQASTWSDDDFLGRWTALFRGPLLVQRYRDGAALSDVELDTLQSMTAMFQQGLTSFSWFMNILAPKFQSH